MANYPLPKFHFEVEWGGEKLVFTEIAGLDTEITPIDYRDGAMKEFHMLKMPGLQTYTAVTLKRGMFRGDNDFKKWYKSVLYQPVRNDQEDPKFRRDVTISLLNEAHEPVVIWKLKRAWPSKVQGTDLNASESAVSIETIEIQHEGIEVEFK